MDKFLATINLAVTLYNFIGYIFIIIGVLTNMSSFRIRNYIGAKQENVIPINTITYFGFKWMSFLFILLGIAYSFKAQEFRNIDCVYVYIHLGYYVNCLVLLNLLYGTIVLTFVGFFKRNKYLKFHVWYSTLELKIIYSYKLLYNNFMDKTFRKWKYNKTIKKHHKTIKSVYTRHPPTIFNMPPKV